MHSKISKKNHKHKIGQRIVFSAWAIGIIVFGAALFRWLAVNPFAWLPPSLRVSGIEGEMTLRIRVIGLLIELAPFVAQIMILVPLRNLGDFLKNGDFLVCGVSVQIRKMGTGFMVFALASVLYDTALYTFAEYMRFPGTLTVHFGLSSTFFYLLISSLVIRILSRAVEEGEKMKEENSQII